jgi:ABC-type Fe3+ transport system permease subunit
MDLWATLGVSGVAGIGAVALGLAVVGVLVARRFRRSHRTERVWVDLSGRG